MKIGFAALAALALAAPAFAADSDPFVKDKVVLNLKGLDLASVDGQQRLAIRMDNAARAVCGDGLATIHLELENQARACRTTVLAQIRSRIESRTADASHRGAVQVAALN